MHQILVRHWTRIICGCHLEQIHRLILSINFIGNCIDSLEKLVFFLSVMSDLTVDVFFFNMNVVLTI